MSAKKPTPISNHRHISYISPPPPEPNESSSDYFKRTGYQTIKMQQTKFQLTKSKTQRQLAVAAFPLRVFTIAQELNRLCTLKSSSITVDQETIEAMDYLENKIRDCYREIFGTELGE